MNSDAKYMRHAETEGYEDMALSRQGHRGTECRRVYKKAGKNAMTRQEYRDSQQGESD